jgi:very-short-patch-repair endonuclease
MTWNKKHIEQLQRDGKIRGYSIPESTKRYSTNHANNIPAKKAKALVWLEWNLQYWSNSKGLELVAEYQFDEIRKWRFDFCFPAVKVALEYEGGIFMAKSGHNTAKHFTKDSDKYNRAAVLGWRVIRVTAMNYKTALDQLNQLIK